MLEPFEMQFSPISFPIFILSLWLNLRFISSRQIFPFFAHHHIVLHYIYSCLLYVIYSLVHLVLSFSFLHHPRDLIRLVDFIKHCKKNSDIFVLLPWSTERGRQRASPPGTAPPACTGSTQNHPE